MVPKLDPIWAIPILIAYVGAVLACHFVGLCLVSIFKALFKRKSR